jgi:hypothetical protein
MEVLNHVIGWITDEWLRVDHKPRLSLGSQNISRVKIGKEACLKVLASRAPERFAILREPCQRPASTELG